MAAVIFTRRRHKNNGQRQQEQFFLIHNSIFSYILFLIPPLLSLLSRLWHRCYYYQISFLPRALNLGVFIWHLNKSDPFSGSLDSSYTLNVQKWPLWRILVWFNSNAQLQRTYLTCHKLTFVINWWRRVRFYKSPVIDKVIIIDPSPTLHSPVHINCGSKGAFNI